MRNIRIFDTTLRDGEQSPGCSMGPEEKIEVARQLERMRVDVIEAGFAISSPGDFASVKTVAETIKNCTVASLSRALEKDIDASWEALEGAAAPRIHLFLSTSPVHMEHKLRMKPEDVLERARVMTAYAKKYCSDVEFSAEDATRTEPEFLYRILKAVIDAGATTVNIPDTVGYNTPEEMAALIGSIRENVENIDKAVISVHCHNDLGMATANSLAAVKAGAGQVECTLNGIGERAGNAAMEEIVMALRTRGHYIGAETSIDTRQIMRSSKLVYNTIGQFAPLNKPIVGANAFAHESGIHQHGVLAEPTTYEIMTPESIGLSRNRLVLGKHSGRHAFEERLGELGYSGTKDRINDAFALFKELCDKKKVITDADLDAIMSGKLSDDRGDYRLHSFEVHAGNTQAASCVIKLIKDGATQMDVALGDGPVDAAYNAVDKLLGLGAHSLENYSINSISEGKDALGEVSVRVRFGETLVSGKGISTDIIEASVLAYLDAINKHGL